jgi:hypothetical protein
VDLFDDDSGGEQCLHVGHIWSYNLLWRAILGKSMVISRICQISRHCLTDTECAVLWPFGYIIRYYREYPLDVSDLVHVISSQADVFDR